MAKTEKASTQKYLKIDEIKDGVAVLKDGSLKSVIHVSSINFALKSEPEKNSIVLGFQGFLNALSYPIQIVARSKKLDLDEYLESLVQRAKSQSNPLLKDQTLDYIDFISRMLEVVNIMDKDFFVVVPYFPIATSKEGLMDKVTGIFADKSANRSNDAQFAQNKTQLDLRVSQVVSGLNSIGLKSYPLDTEQLIELFYSLYNPGLDRTQKIVDITKLGADVIQTSPNGGESNG